MPRIFDNISNSLLPALQQTLSVSDRADFSVGYFNLRGWKQIDHLVENWVGGEGRQCRLLVGMQRLPQEELRDLMAIVKQQGELDNQTALRLKKRLAEDFRAQLAFGAPCNEDENGLRRLSRQLKAKKVAVKLYLRHALHAKLYLCFRPDPINPIVGYVGSSNLTMAGLSQQGELNVDVMDHDAGLKLAKWFEDRWGDRWCLDISAELIQILEQSWARESLVLPYHVYIKIAYHLAQEARAGLSEFRIPPEFGNRLFEYQIAAVKIAAHHLNKRGGVLIGDVVGLGKTLMASAVAKIFQDDHLTETLIICPKNLVKMWEDYVSEYRLLAKVLSVTRVVHELPDLRRYRVVLIDESHNLRNRAGKRYRAIQEYVQENESRCILLSATPYNKTYLDLSNQLRLFVAEDRDLGIRPERLLKEMGETEFLRQHQAPIRSLAAFEKSPYTDDWRELMRLFMVRRTRSFIQDNYATLDPVKGRKFLTFRDGTRSYFPVGGQGKLLLGESSSAYKRFEENVELADHAFRQFREMQTKRGMDSNQFGSAKGTLRKKMKALEDELNRYLATDYGVKVNDKAAYSKWLNSHFPFHWFVEFFGIVTRGGFDVIIGNPPYLEYSKLKDYRIRNYATERCNNLYVFTVERAFALLSVHGRSSMIIPISVACSGAMQPLRNLLSGVSRSIWLSHFSNRPGQLFNGAQNRLTICQTTGRVSEATPFSTRYYRWDARNGERSVLFPTLTYLKLNDQDTLFQGLHAKVGCPEALAVLRKIRSSKTVAFFSSKLGRHKVFWVRVPGYFCQFLLDPPKARPEGGGATRVRGEVNEISFDDPQTCSVIHAVLNSSIYYQFFCAYTDTRHINPSDVGEFPLDLGGFSQQAKTRLTALSGRLTRGYENNKSQWRKSDLLIDSIDSKPCKPIIDEIDTVLALHYGFTDEELDFILNYDIKYRLGRETELEEE